MPFNISRQAKADDLGQLPTTLAVDDSSMHRYSNHELRERWNHEDELIHQRMSWLLGTQTLLFAAYGLALGSSDTAGDDPGSGGALFRVLPVVGFFVAACTAVGILAARAAMVHLLYLANRQPPPLTTWATMKASLSLTDRRVREPGRWQPDVAATTTFGGWLSSLLLHAVFAVSWVYLLIQTH